MLEGINIGVVKDLDIKLAKEQIAKGRAEQVDLTLKKKEVKTKKSKQK